MSILRSRWRPPHDRLSNSHRRVVAGRASDCGDARVKAPTPERYAVLRRWLDASQKRFTSERDLTKAAVDEIQAAGDELDYLANSWRKQAPLPPINPDTGELLEDDIPFELDDDSVDAADAELAIVETEL